jgi:hypothetical protein
MPRNAGELDLNCHTFRGSNEFRTHRFVDDAAIARGERQRIADVFGGGGDIEQQPGFAWVCFLGEVQPKFAVPQCLRRVLENLALSDSRDAAPPVVNVALRNASAAQERCDWDVARAKEGHGHPRGDPVALGRIAWLVSAVTVDAPIARAYAIARPS